MEGLQSTLQAAAYHLVAGLVIAALLVFGLMLFGICVKAVKLLLTGK